MSSLSAGLSGLMGLPRASRMVVAVIRLPLRRPRVRFICRWPSLSFWGTHLAMRCSCKHGFRPGWPDRPGRWRPPSRRGVCCHHRPAAVVTPGCPGRSGIRPKSVMMSSCLGSASSSSSKVALKRGYVLRGRSRPRALPAPLLAVAIEVCSALGTDHCHGHLARSLSWRGSRSQMK